MKMRIIKLSRKYILAVFIVFLFVFNFFVMQKPSLAATSASSIQDKMNKLVKQQAQVQKQLQTSQVLLQKNKVQVGTTKTVIAQTETEISRKEAELQDLNAHIELDKTMLAEYIRQIYYEDQVNPLVEFTFSQSNLNEVFNNFDSAETAKGKIVEVMGQISDAKAGAEQAKADLADKKQTHEQILASQQSQQVDIVGDINDATATLQELNEKINKLRSDLSTLLGVSVSTDDVKKAAGIASGATGVRKSFILGELTQESGLGRYTGGCTYKNTRVKPADATVFKQIMKELGYDINSRKISCAGSIGYGGAMGIAQFMPTTWVGYKSYISGATGHHPPDPWSVIDGVMGMAKKLANAGATSKSGERAASMIYYCGTSHPSNSRIKAACTNYASSVQRLTNGFEND